MHSLPAWDIFKNFCFKVVSAVVRRMVLWAESFCAHTTVSTVIPGKKPTDYKNIGGTQDSFALETWSVTDEYDEYQ